MIFNCIISNNITFIISFQLIFYHILICVSYYKTTKNISYIIKKIIWLLHYFFFDRLFCFTVCDFARFRLVCIIYLFHQHSIPFQYIWHSMWHFWIRWLNIFNPRNYRHYFNRMILYYIYFILRSIEILFLHIDKLTLPLNLINLIFLGSPLGLIQ